LYSLIDTSGLTSDIIFVHPEKNKIRVEHKNRLIPIIFTMLPPLR